MLTGYMPFESASDDFEQLSRTVKAGKFTVPNTCSESVTNLLRSMVFFTSDSLYYRS